MAQIPAEHKRSPAGVRLKQRIYPYLLRSRRAADQFPACLQVYVKINIFTLRGLLTVLGRNLIKALMKTLPRCCRRSRDLTSQNTWRTCLMLTETLANDCVDVIGSLSLFHHGSMYASSWSYNQHLHVTCSSEFGVVSLVM